MAPQRSQRKWEEKWSFPWPVMDVLIAGKSSIDLSGLQVQSRDEAGKFLVSYGYDPDVAEQGRFIHAVLVESLNFIIRHLIPDELKANMKIPSEVLKCTDARDLLVYASRLEPASRRVRTWSCAVLRVMHTIAHIQGVTMLADIDSAFDQIHERFRKFLHLDSEGRLFLGEGDHAVELERVEWKKRKTRDSIILKLLHKPANVAETVYDIIGVRMVTKRVSDVMLVVKFLRDNYIISFPNCNPTRARNTLVDLTKFRSSLEEISDLVRQGRISEDEFEQAFESEIAPSGEDDQVVSHNPHSSTSYRAVQLTCRQLVHAEDERVQWVRSISAALEDEELSAEVAQKVQALGRVLNNWVQDSCHSNSAYFPFEVQILDRKSYDSNISGDASHDKYKVSQISLARKRVLGEILGTS